MNKFCQKVAEYIEKNRLCGINDSMLVGFSGGADSTALLVILARLGYRITAVHLHHGLRGPEADRDAEWCAKFAQHRNIAFERHELHVPQCRKSRESIEMAARRCRLEFWEKRAESADMVALGHHADDAMEDLLLRLVRGANSSGMTGLRPWRQIESVVYIRPLLACRRAEILKFLQQENIHDYCRDTTNQDPQFRRNLVRHQWLPSIQREIGTDQGVMRSLEALAEDADFLETAAAKELETLHKRSDWRKLHPALLPRTLRLWLQKETGKDIVVGHHALLRLRMELNRQFVHPVDIPLGDDLILILDQNRLRLKVKHQVLETRVWSWRDNPVLDLPEIDSCLQAKVVSNCITTEDSVTECFSAAAMPEILTVRAWQSGDRFTPFRSRITKKVHDLFVDEKIPREERYTVPVVLADDKIIWLAGVRRAEFAPVTPKTDQKVILELRSAR